MNARLPFLLFLLNLFLFHFLQAQEVDTTMWVTDGSVRAVVRSGNTIYLGGIFSNVGPYTGSGVVLNESDGKQLFNSSVKIAGAVRASVPDGKGGWYIGGEFTQVQGVSRDRLAHILPTGQLDLAWNPQADGTVYTLLVANNTVYVGGAFNSVNLHFNRSFLAALDATTGELTAWNPRLNGPVYTMAITGTTIYLGGGFFNIGNLERSHLAALNVVTGEATSWNPHTNGDVLTLAIADQTVYVGGSFSVIDTLERKHIAALDANTGKVTSWNPYTDNVVFTLAVSNNLVYVGGHFLYIGGQPRNRLAALDATTGQATHWNPDVNSMVYTLVLASNTVYVGGPFTEINGQKRNHLAALDAHTGKLTPWNPVANKEVYTLAVNAGKVYVGGAFISIGSQPRNSLAALDATTGQATSWNPNTNNGGVYALAMAGNTVYVGGSFTSIGSQARNSVAAVDATTGQPTGWDPNVGTIGGVHTIAISGSTIYIGGFFYEVGGKNQSYLAALDAATGKATAWNPAANDPVVALAVSKNIVYVGGGFSHIGGQFRNYLAALDAKTGQATAWNPHPNKSVTSLALSDSLIYVGGTFNRIGGLSRTCVAALDTTNGMATSWNPEVDAGIFSWQTYVSTLAVSGQMVYIGGVFSTVGNQPRKCLAAIDALTAQPSAWNPLQQGTLVSSVSLYHDAIYVGGTFQEGDLANFAVFGKKPVRTNQITGTVYQEENADCLKSPHELGLAGQVLIVQPGNYFGSTDSLGRYAIAVDTGRYTVQQVITGDKVEFTQQTCPGSPAAHSVHLTKPNETLSGKDFGNQLIYKPFLSVSVSSTRRRRCFAGETTLSYQNAGTADAENVRVFLKLPPYVVLVRADEPYELDKNNTYVFTIGKLAANTRGRITVLDSVACGNPSIRGLTQCTQVWITPINQKNPSPDWDQSDITLKAACLDNGFVRLGIYNSGLRSMADSSAIRIYVDAQLAWQAKCKLLKGDSLILQVPANGRTVRLEADQRPHHPRKRQSTLTMEACGTKDDRTVSKGFVTQFPTDDEGPEIDMECLPIIDSFDPNDKMVSPQGVTSEKYTPTQSELDYVIRFQNTGTDVAYKVVVVDTLSEEVDLSTLQMRASSHPYQVQVSGKGRAALTWTFLDINLPDSSSNQVGSNGFVRFSIKPKANLPEKTRIENAADIFFDYNEPVRTNTTLNTLYDVPPVVIESAKLDESVVCTTFNRVASAGINRQVCEQDTVYLAATSPLKGQGQWKKISGTGLIQQTNQANSLITGLGYGNNGFEWSVPVSSCLGDSLVSRVIITRLRPLAKPRIILTGNSALRCTEQADSYQWYYNGEEVGINAQTIQVYQFGAYSVQINDRHCKSVISDVFQYVITGLEASTGMDWKVYPNPHAGYFTVEFPAAVGRVTQIAILDALGKKVYSQWVTHRSNEEVDFSGYAQGTYFIQLITEKGSFVKRMVKQ